jgi:formate dehydrogenase subunit delta
MSGDSVEKLVYMANQIARNLMHEPDPASATAAHIKAYWSPRMKAQILAVLDGGELEPVALAALQGLR